MLDPDGRASGWNCDQKETLFFLFRKAQPYSVLPHAVRFGVVWASDSLPCCQAKESVRLGPHFEAG